MQAEEHDKKLRHVVEDIPIKIRHLSGSSAGAGSGEFHIYRKVRLSCSIVTYPDGKSAMLAESACREAAHTHDQVLLCTLEGCARLCEKSWAVMTQLLLLPG